MHMRTGFLIAAILGFLGCSSSTATDAGDGGSPLFVGNWVCTEALVETGSTGSVSSSKLTISAIGNGKVKQTFTPVGAADGEPGCTFTASTSGSSLTWDTGQACSLAPDVTLSFASGTATLSGSTLVYNLAFTRTGDAGSAMGTVSGVCTRGDVAPLPPPPACMPRPTDAAVPAFVPPSRPRSVCTPAQIKVYYDACWSATSTRSGCDFFSGDPSNSPCIDCMYVSQGARTYGPIVGYAIESRPNFAGCVSLVDRDTSAASCGAALQGWDACSERACQDVCTDIGTPQGHAAAVACLRLSSTTTCDAYRQAAQCAQDIKYSSCFFVNFESAFRGLGQIFCAAGSADSGAAGDASVPGNAAGDSSDEQ
jgi:hypothetical protein